MKPEEKETSLSFYDEGHHADVLDRLNSLRKNGHFCDVVLQIGKNELPAHRAVLASASGYLMELLSRIEQEGCDGNVKLNMSYEEFQVLLDYIYTGRLEVDGEKVRSVYRMSRKLRMPRAAEACVNFMTANLEPENCLGTRASGYGNRDTTLTEVCDSYIGDHVKEVASSKDCLALPRAQVDIVGTDDITINDANADSLFNLVLGWIRHKIEDEDCEDDIISDHVHVLYLSADNVLHDCKDLDDLTVDEEYIKDYIQLSKKRQTPGKGRKELKNGACNGEATSHRKLNFQPREEELDAEKEWKIIASEKTGEHQYMCICVLEDKLATLTVHLRQRPSSAASGDGSETGSVSPRVPRKAGSGKSGSSSPTHLDRQMSLIPMAKMSSARSGLGSVIMDGKIVAVGGYERGECLATVEEYDIRNNRWAQLPDMRNPRGRFDATMCDGFLYACGGSNGIAELRSAEYYDPGEKKWIMLKDMNKQRASPGTAAWRGRLYCIGGSNGQGGMKSCEMYDPETKEWTEIAPMGNRRAEAGVCVLNDLIYAVGGCDSWNCLNTVEVYDPAENTWEVVSIMNSCRRGAGVVAFMGKVWVIGGSDGQSSLTSVEIYDPEQNSWTSGPPTVTPRVNLSATVVNSRIYILGGFSGKQFLDTMEYLDTETNEWCTYVPGASPSLLPVIAKLNGVH